MIWYDTHLKTENQAIQIFHSYLCKPLFVRFAVDVGLVGGLAGDRQVAVLASDWRGLSMIQVDQIVSLVQLMGCLALLGINLKH